MHYELYIDSLFVVNFTMNLYQLMLVNNSYNRAATRFRIMLGAALDGAVYCGLFLMPFGSPLIKLVTAIAATNCGILCLVFRPCSLKAFFRLLERMACCAFLTGGVFYFLLNCVPGLRERAFSTAGLLGAGGLIWLYFTGVERSRRKEGEDTCVVVFDPAGRGKVSVPAVIDTGNSLREPISGKPVSVVDREVFDRLFEGAAPEGFRAIPYRSVGCAHGVMRGYRIPEVEIVKEGIRKVCKDVYIAVSDEEAVMSGGCGMLLHPAHLKGFEERKRRK